MRVIGIDPGKSGGIAVAIMGESVCYPMPDTEKDTWELIVSLHGGHLEQKPDAYAYIEKVHAMPGQGVTSMFNFGMNYGMLRAFLVAAGIPFETVTPQKWQKFFGLIRKDKNETNTQKKNRHKAKAQEIFPDLKITHKVADCLLIAEYGWRTHAGL